MTISERMIQSLRQYNEAHEDKPIRELTIDRKTEEQLIQEAHELFKREVIVDMSLDGIRLSVLQDTPTTEQNSTQEQSFQAEYVPMRKL